eukprot:TRINITY_DN8983_c0_g1_i1.p1 TRINITY_DN8983_c0_g1~~TRINITY_DN8983_c0_g1_i1.p1  ORF type:complete len:695 (+),score=183.74 TRINITY_DN8983_c0_g1_i1:48-2087(+)
MPDRPLWPAVLGTAAAAPLVWWVAWRSVPPGAAEAPAAAGGRRRAPSAACEAALSSAAAALKAYGAADAGRAAADKATLLYGVELARAASAACDESGGAGDAGEAAHGAACEAISTPVECVRSHRRCHWTGRCVSPPAGGGVCEESAASDVYVGTQCVSQMAVIPVTPVGVGSAQAGRPLHCQGPIERILAPQCGDPRGGPLSRCLAWSRGLFTPAAPCAPGVAVSSAPLIRRADVAGREDCADLCRRDARCYGFTHTGRRCPGAAGCHLYGGAEGGFQMVAAADCTCSGGPAVPAEVAWHALRGRPKQQSRCDAGALRFCPAHAVNAALPGGSWQGDDFVLPAAGCHRFTRSSFLRTFAGKRIVFAGDSTMRQLFSRLVLFLRGLPRAVEYQTHLDQYYAIDDREDVLVWGAPGQLEGSGSAGGFLTGLGGQGGCRCAAVGLYNAGTDPGPGCAASCQRWAASAKVSDAVTAAARVPMLRSHPSRRVEVFYLWDPLWESRRQDWALLEPDVFIGGANRWWKWLKSRKEGRNVTASKSCRRTPCNLQPEPAHSHMLIDEHVGAMAAEARRRPGFRALYLDDVVQEAHFDDDLTRQRNEYAEEAVGRAGSPQVRLLKASAFSDRSRHIRRIDQYHYLCTAGSIDRAASPPTGIKGGAYAENCTDPFNLGQLQLILNAVAV